MCRLVLLFILVCNVKGILFPLYNNFIRLPITKSVIKIAQQNLNELKPYVGVEDRCDIELNDVICAQMMDLHSVYHILDIRVSSYGHNCTKKTKICNGVGTYSPHKCKSNCHRFLWFETSGCLPDYDVQLTCSEEIDTPMYYPQLLHVAKEAVISLNHIFNVSESCPLHLYDIQRALQEFKRNPNESDIPFNSYSMDIHVVTNNLECKHLSLLCTNVQIVEYINCPLYRATCILLINREDIVCKSMYSRRYAQDDHLSY